MGLPCGPQGSPVRGGLPPILCVSSRMHLPDGEAVGHARALAVDGSWSRRAALGNGRLAALEPRPRERSPWEHRPGAFRRRGSGERRILADVGAMRQSWRLCHAYQCMHMAPGRRTHPGTGANPALIRPGSRKRPRADASGHPITACRFLRPMSRDSPCRSPSVSIGPQPRRCRLRTCHRRLRRRAFPCRNPPAACAKAQPQP